MIDFLIVGAGLYGATCARILQDSGFSCLIIDKRNHIAGNIYTKTHYNGYANIDIHTYGPHIFHTDNERVWDFITTFDNFIPFQLNTLAMNNDKLYHLPFNLTTMYELFGTNDITKIKEYIGYEIIKSKIDVSNITNLEEQAISMVGTSIYETLIKGYTEKQWGKPCTELSPEIIKRLPIRYSFNNNYFNDRYQGMPEHGYTYLIEKMIKGIPYILNEDYLKRIDYWNAQANNVIYCGAPDELLNYEFGELEWRSLMFVNKTVDTANFQGTAVINYTNSNVPYTRVIEHQWFTPYKYNERANITYITYEHPKMWKIGDERYYPINNEDTNKLYQKYVNEIKNRYPNLYLGGRLGLYKYFDMDDTIENAINFVNNICRVDSKYNINYPKVLLN